jgi:sodium-dependent phosphate transporter
MDAIFEKLTEYTWILACSFITSFAVAFFMGANDVANSFATAVGSKALTLRQACIIAAFAEFLGAVALGGRVTETIKKGIADPNDFQDDPEELMLGMFTATIGTASWLFVATYFKLPVSSSHSVVAAVMGFTIVARGFGAIDWIEFAKIASSWVLSPVLSGIISVAVYMCVKYAVLIKEDPFAAGLRFVPIIYGITLFINVTPVTNQIFYVVEQYKEADYDENCGTGCPPYAPPYESWVPLVCAISAGIFAGLVTGIFVALFVVPRQRKSIANSFTQLEETIAEKSPIVNADSAECYRSTESSVLINKPTETINQQKAEKLFSFLQTLTATFNSFVHGSNDVSNAIGPLAAVYTIWQTGSVFTESETQIWILAYGGVGIVLGLAIWGKNVIETLGTNITHLTPSRGFTIELGAATTVLIASRAGIPVSTTHCMVGSVVAVGYASNDGSVSWRLFGKIFASWIVTIPFAALITAAFFAALRPTL